MSDQKHPFFSVIAMSFAFGMAVWFGADELVIKGLRDTISQQQLEIDKLNTDVRYSKEYKELQSVMIESRESYAFCKEKLSDHRKLSVTRSSLETENKRLIKSSKYYEERVSHLENVKDEYDTTKAENYKIRELLDSYKKALSARDTRILNLKSIASTLAKITELEEKQEVEEEYLQDILTGFGSKNRSEIIRSEKRILMLQDRINILAKNMNGRA